MSSWTLHCKSRSGINWFSIFLQLIFSIVICSVTVNQLKTSVLQRRELRSRTEWKRSPDWCLHTCLINCLPPTDLDASSQVTVSEGSGKGVIKVSCLAIKEIPLFPGWNLKLKKFGADTSNSIPPTGLRLSKEEVTELPNAYSPKGPWESAWYCVAMEHRRHVAMSTHHEHNFQSHALITASPF